MQRSGERDPARAGARGKRVPAAAAAIVAVAVIASAACGAAAPATGGQRDAGAAPVAPAATDVASDPGAFAAGVAGAADDGTTVPSPAGPPARLADTGLYADASLAAVAQGVLAFSPQYPLWTDGARKRRWIRLPPGTAIDATDPDAWQFPAGTKLWKEFAAGDRRIETRYLERRPDGTWSYATYVWSADGRDAVLAPERGIAAHAEVVPGTPYDVPSVADCRACHEGKPEAVLGFSALQLSPDRDPLAPHADPPRPGDVDLATLVARGLVRGLPAELVATPPRIEARTPRERAALGYLHGNCSSCHNARGPLADLGLSLEQRVAEPTRLAAHDTAVGQRSRFQPAGAAAPALRVAPGDPGASVLVARVASRNPVLQMPPLGTRVADDEASALLSAWVRELGRSPHVSPGGRVASLRLPRAAPHTQPKENDR